MRTRVLFILSALYILVTACSSVNQIYRRNLSYLYNTAPNSLHPDFAVFHKSKEKSILYFKINKSDLLYAKPNNSNKFSGGIKLSYKLLADYGTRNILDSASIIKIDSAADKSDGVILDSIVFNADYPNQYLLNVNIADLNKKSSYETILRVEKSNYYASQNFLVKTVNKLPAFKNYFSSNEQFSIYVNSSKYKKVLVKHFTTQFPVAAPPFIEVKENTIKMKPDSVFYFNFNNGQTENIRFKKQGIYYLQLDSSVKKGIAIFRYYNDFPEITNTSEMIYPLRYLTSSNEYERMLYAKDKKAEIDNFWLEIAGNPDRAIQLIKKYYSRVSEANGFFTSYIPGWKTDRGIIYIIYGPPNTVNKSGEIETWYYGTPQNIKSIVFYFYRVDNPFTYNDYNLVRTQNYKNSWYMAIESWRR